jgi:hypothetical protein
MKFLFFIISLPLCAQAALPSNYIGIGFGYNGGTVPNYNVTATFATMIAKSSPAIYSYTSTDYSSARTKPFSVKSSLRTGPALMIHNWQYFAILEMLTAGAAGGNNGGVYPSIGIGGIVVLKLPQGWTLAIDIHESNAVGSNQSWALQSVFEFGHVW